MAFLLSASLCAALLAASQDAPAPAVPAASPARVPELLDNDALHARIVALAKAHPECATHFPIGFTRERRPLDVLRLSAGEPAKARPAILVVANVDGPQTFSSAVALAHATALAEGFAGDVRVKRFLESTTVYVLARANPDAAASRWATPLAEVEAGGTGVDNDRDRRDGEDPPSDVDGDGVISWMRWRDPEGEWVPDPKDARVMVKADAKKGQLGAYKLAPEGRDLDHDEAVSEDGPRDAVLNQNFPHDWAEHAPAAGRFPLDEPEARAIADFVLQHEDIALVVTYGTLDTVIEKPKSVADNAPAQRRVPQPGWLESDAQLLAELSKRYGELVGNKTKGRGVEAGSFQAWAYQHRGLWSLAIPLWDVPTEAKKKEGEASEKGEGKGEGKGDGKGDAKGDAKAGEQDKGTEQAPAKPAEKPAGGDAKPDEPAKGGRSGGKGEKEDKPNEDVQRLAWIDSAGEGARFLAWKPFQHPDLGPVELGGFAPFARSEPPAAAWPDIARKELDFLLSLGPDLPRVSIEKLEAKRLSSGLIEVEATVLNDSLLPVASKSGQRAEAVRPLRARLVLPDGAQLVGGSKQTLIRDLGGKARRELRWLVLCEQPLQIGLDVDSENAGAAQKVVEVQR